MDIQATKDYIALMPFTDAYESYDAAMQDKIIFASWEQLIDTFDEEIITSKMAALQTIYMADGYKDEHAKMKMQGVKSFGLDGMSFSYDGTLISPAVSSMIDKILNPPAASSGPPIFGRLI